MIFGRLAAELIGLPALTLAQGHKDRYTVPPVMTRIYGMERIFQVVISSKNDDPYNLSFKVMHIFKQTNFLNEQTDDKSRLNLPTSILLHKPLTNSLTSSAKRCIDFGESSAATLSDVKESEKSHDKESPFTTITIE